MLPSLAPGFPALLQAVPSLLSCLSAQLTTTLMHQALAESRWADAARLLARCVQEQEGFPLLEPGLEAHLQAHCYEVIVSGPRMDPHLREKAQGYLYALLMGE